MYQAKVSKEINFVHNDNAISYWGSMFQVHVNTCHVQLHLR